MRNEHRTRAAFVLVAAFSAGCAQRGGNPTATGEPVSPSAGGTTKQPVARSQSTSAGPYSTVRQMVEMTDPVNGSRHMVLEGVELRGRDRATLSMMVSTVLSHSFITEHAAKELGAVDLGGIELPPTGPLSEGIVDEPAHLRSVYGMNPEFQRRFRKVRIDRVHLGVGPALGPVEALVLDDANSSIGAVGRDWLSHGADDKGFIIAAGEIVYFGKLETRQPQ